MGLTVMLDASRGGSLCCSAMLGQVYWLGIYDSAGSCTLSQALGKLCLPLLTSQNSRLLEVEVKKCSLCPLGTEVAQRTISDWTRPLQVLPGSCYPWLSIALSLLFSRCCQGHTLSLAFITVAMTLCPSAMPEGGQGRSWAATASRWPLGGRHDPVRYPSRWQWLAVCMRKVGGTRCFGLESGEWVVCPKELLGMAACKSFKRALGWSGPGTVFERSPGSA